MTFEAAIFDLDGTLLNSMHVWEQIDIEFLQKRGLPVPADYVVEICARSFEEAAQYTIELFGLPETIDDIIKEWNVMAAYEYAYNVKIQSYAMDYLLQLKSRGIKLAVATGLPKELFIPCLKNNSVLHFFLFFALPTKCGMVRNVPTCLNLQQKDCVLFPNAALCLMMCFQRLKAQKWQI